MSGGSDLITTLIKVGVAITVMAVTITVGYDRGSASVQGEWDADNLRLASAQIDAVRVRLVENAAIENKQAADNAAITKVNNDEINLVRRALAASERMRVPAFCANSGPAAQAGPAGASSGDAADTGSWLVPDRVEADIEAIILRTEEVAASARAAQAFIRVNGVAPP